MREPGDDSFAAERRFLEVFRSNTESFVVRQRVSETAAENGKRAGVYTTRSRQVSLSDVAAHFDGKTCLVLKPELPDGTCLWGMIDHDTYSSQRCQIIREEIEFRKLPLNPFPSKSGGLHSAIFLKAPQAVAQVRMVLAEFAKQLGEHSDYEIFPKVVSPGKMPYGIAMPFFGERDKFEQFEPILYCGALNGHTIPPDTPSTHFPAYGVKLPEGTDFGELLRGKLRFDLRHEAGGISYDYHGLDGQPCLIKGTLHSSNKSNPREARFFVKDGYVCHQCFHVDCQGETEPKTRKALQVLGIGFHGAFRRSLPHDTIPWPDTPAPVAFHGLAGKVVHTIEPHSEADPAALLVQFLVAFGNVIGRGRFFCVEDTEHYGNCFALIVGATSKARKGTSWSRIERIFDRLDGDSWASLRIFGGVGSGEGIIEQVRDPVVKGSEVDGGATDKRLMLHETEFAQVLAVNKREGNTASEVLRRAWDGATLQTLTRQKSSLRASGAHVSLIGHITREELLRHLDQTEVANGLMNRFLICCAKRSKFLPDGGSLTNEELSSMARELAAAVGFAKEAGELRRDAEASDLWYRVYAELSEDRPGLFGALVARAEAQVLRLSLLYALLDRSDGIRRVHLEAALALWHYCEQSARHVFGDALGNPIADEILRALRTSASGLTRTQIMDLFGRNRSKNQIGQALSVLVQHGLANFASESTEGRPIERWYATRGGKAGQ